MATAWKSLGWRGLLILAVGTKRSSKSAVRLIVLELFHAILDDSILFSPRLAASNIHAQCLGVRYEIRLR